MISYIKGTVEDIYEDRIIVECNDIGYNIFSPAVSKVSIGQQVKIFTYLAVREDAMQLFGFLTKDELLMFNLLLGVSGIGPKGAINILISIPLEELKLSIANEDSKRISKAKGIGTKTASRIVMELKDKIDYKEAFTSEVMSANVSTANDNVKEAIDALCALGYSVSDATKAVKAATALMGIDGDLQSIIKSALKQFS